MPPTSRCYHFNCGTFGEMLKCYVNTGNTFVDLLISTFISANSPSFCTPGLFDGPRVSAPCGQKCNKELGTHVIRGRDWPTCPVAHVGVDECEMGGGYEGLIRTELNDFALYSMCPDGR